MGRKIFVSYKYADDDVLKLPNRKDSKHATTARDYVDYLENRIDRGDSIYKGEQDGEDLSDLEDSTIQSKLSDKIFDSSVTVLLISPNMKEPNRWEKSQWIPWEISYSLRRETRNSNVSRSNALVGVILPNRRGSYDYFDGMAQFGIVKRNIESGYMKVVKWDAFIANMNYYLDAAVDNKGKAQADTKI